MTGPFGRPYIRADFENAQALRTIEQPDTFMYELAADYAASFYGQIRAIVSSAITCELAEVALWK